MSKFLSFFLMSLIACSALAHGDDGTAPPQALSQASDTITRHAFEDSEKGTTTPYLLYHPANDTPTSQRSLLIFLYGAGGSIENYNFKRPPYAMLRGELAARGYYVVVPELGPKHFMSDAAKAALDGVVSQVLKEEEIPQKRVHVMGTSMGAGSSLAYAIHRPDLIRSVCAVMPMTDFATWVVENPRYEAPVAKAYGGTYAEMPEAYDRNAALKNPDAFAKIPVMLIHGNADNTVLYSNSQKLAELLQEKKYVCEFYTAAGQGHKDEVMQDFQTEAIDFFEAASK